MKKIPTLFERDPDDRRHVMPIITPGCEWVMAGEGIATRKYDGTCVMFDGARWWARREVKPGKNPPDGWIEVDHDEITGKRVGWEPADQSGFSRWLNEARLEYQQWEEGTYELCGPKINGNPERYETHELIRHADATWYRNLDRPSSYDELATLMADFSGEGIVWHHPDGRMAKLKRRDFE